MKNKKIRGENPLCASRFKLGAPWLPGMISQCQAPPHAPLLESAMAHGNPLSGFALQLQSSAINQFSNVGHRVSKVKLKKTLGGLKWYSGYLCPHRDTKVGRVIEGVTRSRSRSICCLSLTSPSSFLNTNPYHHGTFSAPIPLVPAHRLLVVSFRLLEYK